MNLLRVATALRAVSNVGESMGTPAPDSMDTSFNQGGGKDRSTAWFARSALVLLRGLEWDLGKTAPQSEGSYTNHLTMDKKSTRESVIAQTLESFRAILPPGQPDGILERLLKLDLGRIRIAYHRFVSIFRFSTPPYVY